MSIINEIQFERMRIETGYWQRGEVAPAIELVCGPAVFAKIAADRLSAEMLSYSPEGVYLLADMYIAFDDAKEDWVLLISD